MYKIKIYKDLGFDDKNQRFFVYSDNFEPTLLLKTLSCNGVFNGARTTVDVKVDESEFQNIFVYAHNIVIENEKQRVLFFYVQNVEQITRDTIRFYLTKDYFHSYFNNEFAGRVEGWVTKCNHKGVLSRRGSGIIPLFSRTPTAKTLLSGNTNKQWAIGLFTTNNGYFVAIPDSDTYPKQEGAALWWAINLPRVQQYRDTLTLTKKTCKCVARWFVPQDFVERMSNFKSTNPDYQLTFSDTQVTNPDWYNAFSVDIITQRDYIITNANVLRGNETSYVEIGTPFTRTEFKPSPRTQTKFSILILSQAGQLSILLKLSNKLIDLTTDFQIPIVTNDSQREYEEFAIYRALDKFATTVGFANGLQQNPVNVGNYLSYAKTIQGFQERDLSQQLTFSTITGSGNGRTVHFIDESYSFGLFFTEPDNYYTADLCYEKLRDADGKLTLEGNVNEAINTFSPDGELYVEMHNVKVRGIPKEAENAIKAMFENGIFIQYEKTI